ncbi:MAG: hydroxyacylglutathione hydrolase [Gammaproteobacteria bacterium]|jgi:hydroxyacylglutathione hydrolase
MINIEPIEAFSDNYIWLLTTNEGSIVIDPGESQNLLKILKENKFNLKAILITHHHFDHTGGINEILSEKSIDVYGPNNNIDSINIRVTNESKINLLGIEFEIIEIPGHTLDHIAYYSENNGRPILFCGDTLFSGGCGRVFEGTFEQMHDSLSILKELPVNTKIYCGHEYTESNLKFAKSVEPLNQKIISRYNEVIELRKQGIPSLPTTLELELETNPFLRVGLKEVQQEISKKFNIPKNDKDIFTAMRQWKDNF